MGIWLFLKNSYTLSQLKPNSSSEENLTATGNGSESKSEYSE